MEFKTIRGKKGTDEIEKLLSVLAQKGVITEADAEKVKKGVSDKWKQQ